MKSFHNRISVVFWQIIIFISSIFIPYMNKQEKNHQRCAMLIEIGFIYMTFKSHNQHLWTKETLNRFSKFGICNLSANILFKWSLIYSMSCCNAIPKIWQAKSRCSFLFSSFKDLFSSSIILNAVRRLNTLSFHSLTESKVASISLGQNKVWEDCSWINIQYSFNFS